MEMKEKIITDINGLASYREDWRRVLEGSSRKSFFISEEYIAHWYSCFRSEGEVRIYIVRKEETIIGFLPLILKRRKGYQIIEGLNNDHCLHSDPLVVSGYEKEFQGSVLRMIMGDGQSWDLLRYNYTYSFSAFPGLFSDELLRDRSLRWNKSVEETYLIRLEASFEDYLKKDLSPNIRKSFKRRRNKFQGSDGAKFLHFRNNEALEYWEEFVEIEDSGWKGRRRTSIRSLGKEYKKYYEGLVRLLARKEGLDLFFLEIGGKKIAGVFGYREGEIFHSAKTGYNEGYSSYSPSNLLLLAIVEHLFHESLNIKCMHLFPWDHGYKHWYANEMGSFISLTLYNESIGGRVLGAMDGLQRKMKGHWLAQTAIRLRDRLRTGGASTNPSKKMEE